MKVNFFSGDYNLKIDYLICKNLLMDFPYQNDEFSLRKAFLKKYKNNYELKQIIKIKKYLNRHKLAKFNLNNYKELIYIISGKRINYNYKIKFNEFKRDNLYDYILYLRYLDDYKLSCLMLKIMILYLYAKNNEIIIPFRENIDELLSNLISYNESIGLICDLENRTLNLNRRHDIRVNKLVRDVIKDKKNEFLNEFMEIKEFYIYGSFSVGKENEYSDINMLFICKNINSNLINEIKLYWSNYISININIKLINLKEFDNELNDSIKKTLRMVM